MQTEDLVVDEGGKRKIIEQICEVFPDVGVTVLPEALVVEAVHLGDLAGLVIAAKDGDALRVSNFERYQESDGLDREVAPINIVT